MPQFRLQTLGSLSLHEQSGVAVPGHGSQRRRLALLAVLAASGDRGRSRDSLLALFWPDVSTERARHSLEQLLYAIRSSVHNEAFVGVNPISLNPEAIRSDVREFERALAGDRLEDAIAEYHGSFLEGFVLPDALEFEQWIDGERARLANAFARALEALAVAAERRSDFQGAAEWWQKRAAHDPYDSRIAQCLMRALDASGNRALAIQHAAIHERLLRQELGVQAATGASALADRMRVEPRAPSSENAPDVAFTSAVPSASPMVRRESPAGAPVEPKPPGARTSAPLDHSATSAGARRRRIVLGSLGLVVAAVAIVLAWNLRAVAPPPERSIAVLPFLDMSPRGDNEYFSDGITEEIITQLSTVPTLKVISRTSAMRYKKSTKSLGQIARELGVAHVLEGSVRRDGDAIRITAQLIDAAADHHLWSHSYDRTAANVIGVQDEIAREVGRALEVELGGAQGALALDDQSADAHASFAIALWWQRDWPGAERELRRSIELNPGYVTARTYYALLLSGMSRLDEAVEQSRRASELDPLGAFTIQNRASMFYAARMYDPAIEQFNRALELSGDWGNAYTRLSVAYAQRGMHAAATRAASKAVALGGTQTSDYLADLAYVHARAGRKADAEQFLQRAKTHPWEGYNIARAYVALGEPDSAFAWLDRSSCKWPHRALRADPALDPLRSDPRFVRLSARIDREMGLR